MGKHPHNEILVSGGINELCSEELDFRLMQENGSDYILMAYLHDEKSKFNLRMLEKYGIKAFFYDTELNGTPVKDLTTEKILDASADYRRSPAFLGFGIIDEPPAEKFYDIGRRVDAYRAAVPEALCHVNLLPWYAFNDDKLFKRYLHGFTNYVDINHVSTDDYPLWQQPDGSFTTNSCFYRGLMLSACEARDCGREHWGYLYSYSKTAERGYRVLTQEDLFFEAYSHLLFGVSKYSYFCFDVTGFRGKRDDPSLPYCMRNHNRDKTELFDYSKVLNEYLHALSPVFCKYTWKDANCVLCDNKNERFLKALLPYNKTALKDVHANVGLGIGTFDKTEGNGRAFVIMNASEVTDRTTADVSFKVPKARTVTLYLAGKSERLKPDEDGTYRCTLAPGMGAFLTAEY